MRIVSDSYIVQDPSLKGRQNTHVYTNIRMYVYTNTYACTYIPTHTHVHGNTHSWIACFVNTSIIMYRIAGKFGDLASSLKLAKFNSLPNFP